MFICGCFMDKLLYNTLLFDFYGELLTEKQREAYYMYFCEDMSLAEIGERLDISRQAVNSSIKQARRSFDGFEEALGLVRRHVDAQNCLIALEKALERRDYEDSGKILTELSKFL